MFVFVCVCVCVCTLQCLRNPALTRSTLSYVSKGLLARNVACVCVCVRARVVCDCSGVCACEREKERGREREMCVSVRVCVQGAMYIEDTDEDHMSRPLYIRIWRDDIRMYTHTYICI